MDLAELRQEIDKIDEEILNLFIKRMNVCRNVADYKKEKNLSVLQGDREKQLIERIRELSPDNLKDGAAVLFASIMDISKCIQQQEISKSDNFVKALPFEPEKAGSVVCQGTEGSYSEKACRKLFKSQKINFVSEFEDVFKAVDSGECEFGVLPLQNSTVGSVSKTYDLMAKYDFYINAVVRVEIKHCLAAKKGTALNEIEAVYSHEQALSQCSDFIRHLGLEQREYPNTALAAKLVAESNEKIACICSPDAAEIYGLEILESQAANVYPNYTRFICISKRFIAKSDAGTISVSLSIPHTKSSLYRLLTKFSVNGFNLVKIENKPVAGKDFEVIFYLDFSGNCNDVKAASLLEELKGEHSYFKFLGNFDEVM